MLWRQTQPAADDTDTGDREEKRPRLLVRAYAVFAVEQVDGADEIIARHQVERDAPEQIDAAERFFAAVDAHVIEGGNRAYYQPAVDEIHVPALAQFDEAAHFYATLAHEHAHWTGHPDRLARDLSGRFGDDGYAAEELVAELAAAMWCARHGVSADTRSDHAAYLAGWLRILRADTRALGDCVEQGPSRRRPAEHPSRPRQRQHRGKRSMNRPLYRRTAAATRSPPTSTVPSCSAGRASSKP